MIKTAVDDRRHSNEEDRRAVVNVAIAAPYTSIYRNCSEEVEKRNQLANLIFLFQLLQGVGR